MALKVYVGGLMTGRSWKQVKEVFTYNIDSLKEMGYDVFHPLIGKHFPEDEVLTSTYFDDNPFISDKSILHRDHWMCCQCDILFMDLLGAEKISCGCPMEIGWAWEKHKHIITLMEENNVYQHAFIKGASDIILSSRDKALEYMSDMSSVWKSKYKIESEIIVKDIVSTDGYFDKKN